MVHHALMIPTQRLPASLTPLDVALAALLQRLEPVAPVALPLAEALGCVAADMPPLERVPPRDIAASDGWALRARDLVGASSYSPLPLAKPPVWVEAGDAMPEDCDCVVDADSVDQTGPVFEVLAEAIPGQGVRRAGGDIAEGSLVIAPGQRIRPLDLLIARAAGLRKTERAPAAPAHRQYSRGLGQRRDGAADRGKRARGRRRRCPRRGRGARCGIDRSGARARRLRSARHHRRQRRRPHRCDGRGIGAGAARSIAHGIALQPGRTSAVGGIGKIPVLALPGAPDQALAAWWTLALPALDRLSGLRPRPTVTLPLARKIASSVGIAEIVLLERIEDAWMPLAVGEMPLATIARSDAWLLVPGGSEGFAAGTPVDAYMLRD